MTTHSDEANCAWSDYRKDYGVSPYDHIRHSEHKAFHAGWDAAKADIRQAHYLIPLADLPEVRDDRLGRGIARCDGKTFVIADNLNQQIKELWRTARMNLALAHHIEARESEAAVLARRRDELVQRYSPSQLGYDDIQYTDRRLVDHALDAEDRAAAAEAELARVKGEKA